MDPTQIHIDTKELEMVLATLPIFSKDLKQELNEIQLSLNILADSWQDDEYVAFKKDFGKVHLSLDSMDHQLANHYADLKRDLEALKEYLKVTS